MVCKSRGIYGFLGPSQVLITYNICPPVSSKVRFMGPCLYHVLYVRGGSSSMYPVWYTALFILLIVCLPKAVCLLLSLVGTLSVPRYSFSSKVLFQYHGILSVPRYSFSTTVLVQYHRYSFSTTGTKNLSTGTRCVRVQVSGMQSRVRQQSIPADLQSRVRQASVQAHV